ncbi:MAG: hypothetical protein AAGF12_07695, partial [Myxococcota bacterium]
MRTRRYRQPPSVCAVVTLVLLAGPFLGHPRAQGQAPDRSWTVSVVRDEGRLFQRHLAVLRQEAAVLLTGAARVEFVTTGDGVTSVAQAQAQLSAAPAEVDVWLSIGPLSGAALEASSGPAPRVVSMVYDSELPAQGAYVVPTLGSLEAGADALQRVTGAATVTVLVDRRLAAEGVRRPRIVGEHGYELEEVEVAGESPLSELPDQSRTGVFHLGGLPYLTEESQDGLFRALAASALSVGGSLDPGAVERGALLTTLPEDIDVLRARRTALVLREIANGRIEPRVVPFQPLQRLVVNMQVLRERGHSPPFATLLEAELLRQERDEQRRIGFAQVASEALSNNLSFRAAGRSVDAGQERVFEQRAPLLPQVRAGVTGNVIDDDRGGGPFPPSEWTFTG